MEIVTVAEAAAEEAQEEVIVPTVAAEAAAAEAAVAAAVATVAQLAEDKEKTPCNYLIIGREKKESPKKSAAANRYVAPNRPGSDTSMSSS